MTGVEFENGVNNVLDNTPKRGVAGSAGITKSIFKQIVAVFKTLLNDVNTVYDAGLFWRGAWSAATAYAVRDVVSQNGSTYRCKTAHTNQAVTNTTFWELLAGRGTDGNVLVNRGGSLYNLLTDTSIGATIDTASDVVPVATWTHAGASQTWVSSLRIPVRLDRLYVIEFEAIKSVAGDLYVTVNCYNKVNSTVSSPYSVSANTTTWAKYAIVYGSAGGISAARFTNDTVNIGIAIASYVANTFKIKNLVFREIPLSEPVAHNLALTLPDGQAVVDPNNPKRLGVYINATQGIEWTTGREIVLAPNGTSVVFNLRRPYKFTWSVVNNDGVTINSQPSATVNAATDALITLSGPAGKSITINIQESI